MAKASFAFFASRIHSELFDGLLNKLNSSLNGLDIEFERELVVTQPHLPFAILKLRGTAVHSFKLQLQRLSERGLEWTKYTTYCGKYQLEICRSPYGCQSAKDSFKIISTIEQILEDIRHDVVLHTKLKN